MTLMIRALIVVQVGIMVNLGAHKETKSVKIRSSFKNLLLRIYNSYSLTVYIHVFRDLRTCTINVVPI